MTERGKYHGQRLKAREVLRLYAAGERDFRGTILRGCNFSSVDLSGADFSGADIRSASFVDAVLKRSKFSHSRGGLQRRWVVVQLALIVVVSTLAGFLQGYSSGLIGYYFHIGIDKPSFLIAAFTGIIVMVINLFAIAQEGFTGRALGKVSGAVTAVVTAAGAGAIVLSGAFVFVFAVAGAIAVAGTIAFSSAVAFAFTGTIVFMGAVIFVIAGVFAIAGAFAVTGAFTVAFISTVAGFFICLHIDRHIRQGNPKFESLRVIGLAMVAYGGTNFSGADLTGATFTNACLKNSNFADSFQRLTTLNRVRWHGAKKLDRARLGSSNLQDPRVRKLLTNLNSIEQDLTNADLRGANLERATLHRTNLTQTNLNGATLAEAELQGADLREAQCLHTDFTQADLTGVCIEAWNIDSSTCLENVQCDYIYLLRNGQERRPNSGSFQPGEFTKLFQEVLDTIDLIFQNGIDWKAFTRTFQQVQIRHDEAELSIQSIANKGDGVVVVKLNAAPETDKASVHADFSTLYQTAIQEAEARYKAQLEAKDDQIADYRQQNANMQEVVKLLASRPVTVDVKAIAESKSMQGNDYSRNVSIGGDFSPTNSSVNINLGEISGQVSNQISQLSDASGDQPSLKTLLG
jgi:uncharacterized protein YjbI with pentapeptide repeats